MDYRFLINHVPTEEQARSLLGRTENYDEAFVAHLEAILARRRFK